MRFLKKARFCILLLLIAVANGAVAGTTPVCPPVPEPLTAEMVRNGVRNARDHGFMWRISKDGHTSYLYGTMHVGKPDWAHPGPSVMQALRATDTVALELDMSDAGIRRHMVNGIASLRHLSLPASLEKRMRQQADALCVPYDSLAKLPPEFQITTLTMMAGRWDGLDATFAIDSVLAGVAHGAKKNVVSLETPEAQMQLLQMKDAQGTIVFVQEGLDELEAGRSRNLLKRISRMWDDADHAGMEHYSEWCDCLDTENERELMKRMLDERNPALADSIDALHASGKRVFAAVGSLHMFGSSGLPLLMSKRGYRVGRVELKTR